ncbi:MAG: antibiotic biosynthesis monooxygenase [Bacteroidetes bacterium MedPE-SWsnd-G2]|nr:MAG: antibiotic biosynthesis monooxygenase [Bacteroidetes bacterium MedPE-SWsnd-G2]
MQSQNHYYAVIFTSGLNKKIEGYEEMANRMEQLAKSQDGFLGIESARNEIGITVSYWQTLDDIKAWKTNSEHLLAQKKGIEEWYDWYNVKICKVEREYSKS